MGIKISLLLSIFIVGLLLVACSHVIAEDVPISNHLLDTATIVNTPLASKILPSHTPSTTSLPINLPTLIPQPPTTPSPEPILKLEPTPGIYKPYQIAFTSGAELFLLNLKNRSRTSIDTDMGTIYGSRMSFSPDGTRLFYFKYGTP